MPLAQSDQCQQASGAIGVEHHGHLAGGTGAPQQFKEHAFGLRMSIFSQGSHEHNLHRWFWRGKCVVDHFIHAPAPWTAATERRAVAAFDADGSASDKGSGLDLPILLSYQKSTRAALTRPTSQELTRFRFPFPVENRWSGLTFFTTRLHR